MKKLAVRFLGGLLLSLFAVLPAARADGVGVVKGTITIGGKPVTDAVVSVEGVPAELAKGGAAQKKVVDQRNMKFIPAVVAIRVGDSVEFPNHDKVWHNVYSKGGANDFDLGLYPPGKTRSQTFNKPGVSRILCNAHPQMEAFVVVKPTRFSPPPIAGEITRSKTCLSARCASKCGRPTRKPRAPISRLSAAARSLLSILI